MSKIYLAGTMGGLTYKEAVSWRDEADKLLESYNMVGVSPVRGSEYTDDDSGRTMWDVKLSQPESETIKRIMCTPAFLTNRDLHDIDTSSAILVNLERISLGTSMEIGYAYRAGTPIFVFGGSNFETVKNHEMLVHMASAIVETLEEAVILIDAFLN